MLVDCRVITRTCTCTVHVTLSITPSNVHTSLTFVMHTHTSLWFSEWLHSTAWSPQPADGGLSQGGQGDVKSTASPRGQTDGSLYPVSYMYGGRLLELHVHVALRYVALSWVAQSELNVGISDLHLPLFQPAVSARCCELSHKYCSCTDDQWGRAQIHNFLLG